MYYVLRLQVYSKMKVYFSGSVFYRDKFIEAYEKIVEVLKKGGYQVLEHTLKMPLNKYEGMTDEDRLNNYKEILKWVDQCDFAVVEASFPSTLHVGHEISLILEKSKPVVVMYKKEHEPTMLKATKDDRIIWAEYKDNTDLEKVLLNAIEVARRSADVRFNFFVSPKILNYLDFVAKKRMIPRSVFLRDLIEKEMKKDKEFKE